MGWVACFGFTCLVKRTSTRHALCMHITKRLRVLKPTNNQSSKYMCAYTHRQRHATWTEHALKRKFPYGNDTPYTRCNVIVYINSNIQRYKKDSRCTIPRYYVNKQLFYGYFWSILILPTMTKYYAGQKLRLPWHHSVIRNALWLTRCHFMSLKPI